jgi:hypothetical protein
MSKESALAMLTGNPTPTVPSNPIPTIPPVLEGQTSTPTEHTELKSAPFSHLAKKEAELVRKREEFKKEQETWSQERARLADAKQKYDDYLKAKETDPVGALKILGFSETDLFNYLANQQPQELTSEQKAAQAAEKAAEAKIKEFQDNQLKKEKEAQDAQDRGLIEGFRNEVKDAIQKNKDKYEYCSYFGKPAEDLAYEITLAVVKESNGEDVITAEEAVRLAEEYYEEEDRAMSQLKKRQPKVETPTQQKTEPTRTRTVTPGHPNADQPKPTVNKSRTLAGTASTIASTRVSRNETKEQKRERLIEALRNGTKL